MSMVRFLFIYFSDRRDFLLTGCTCFILVSQTYIITPQALFLQTTLEIIQADVVMHRPSSSTSSTSKCMVFFPTARQVSFATEVFSQLPNLPPVLEIHSKKGQLARTKAADAFKKAKSAVLLSSDVAARGMDFPGFVFSFSMNTRY